MTFTPYFSTVFTLFGFESRGTTAELPSKSVLYRENWPAPCMNGGR